MCRRFRGTRADSGPGNEVLKILRRYEIERLDGDGQAEGIDVEHQLPANAQSMLDAMCAIQVRIIDQTFPTHCRAGLFEVHAHDDHQRVIELVGQGLQKSRIVHGLVHIVDGTRADHDHQSMVCVIQNALHALMSCKHCLERGAGDGQRFLERAGAGQFFLQDDVQIVVFALFHCGVFQFTSNYLALSPARSADVDTP